MNNIIEKLRWITGASLLAGALGIGVVGITIASSDNANRDHEAYYESDHDNDDKGDHLRGSTAPAPDLYVDECGACHLAYPAALLPERSWSALMSGLDNHFGDNAELDDETRAEITAYLARFAAGHGGGRTARRMLQGLDGKTPLRITELPYFVREHDEVPARLVRDNPEVGSFSQCDTCHRDAAKGLFDEDTVDIPGYGRWDD